MTPVQKEIKFLESHIRGKSWAAYLHTPSHSKELLNIINISHDIPITPYITLTLEECESVLELLKMVVHE